MSSISKTSDTLKRSSSEKHPINNVDKKKNISTDTDFYFNLIANPNKVISKNKDNALSAGRCQTPALKIIYDKQD